MSKKPFDPRSSQANPYDLSSVSKAVRDASHGPKSAPPARDPYSIAKRDTPPPAATDPKS